MCSYSYSSGVNEVQLQGKKRYRVLLYEPIHKVGLNLLSSIADIVYPQDFTEETVLSLVNDVDAIIIRGFGRVTARLMDAAPKLRVIGRHGVALDNIDVEAARERHIYVVNTPTANTESVAEHCLGMMLELSKCILRGDKSLRQGDWKARDRYTGQELYGKTLGIIGFGRIGQRLATICHHGFNMRIVYHDISAVRPHSADELGAQKVSLDDVLRNADYVVTLLPALPTTEHLMGHREFCLMKSTAFFVNCGRGSTVDEAALIETLRSGAIAGAGLDVFEVEPTPRDNPLFQLDNVVVTPHMAALTEEAYQRMAMVVHDVNRVFNGEIPEHWVNPWQ